MIVQGSSLAFVFFLPDTCLLDSGSWLLTPCPMLYAFFTVYRSPPALSGVEGFTIYDLNGFNGFMAFYAFYPFYACYDFYDFYELTI